MGKWAAFLGWYHRQKRVLPWRDEPTLYRVWLSEIMLQQTQVATVVPYFERFMERFPTVRELAEAPEDEVMRMWAGLGYYSRARNLQAAARVIQARGGFPRTRQEWLELPGIGEYTAGAIVSIALNQAEPILDGNVERVLSRLHRVAEPGPGKRRLWELAALAVTEASREGYEPRDFNQALMELGATVCTPRNPACMLCPLGPRCEARDAGDWAAFPPKRQAKKWEKVEETVFYVSDPTGRVLLRKREKGEWRAGLWDLPEQLPERGVGELAEVGSFKSRYVVTNHKIERTTRIFAAARSFGQGPEHLRWKASDSASGAEPSFATVDLRRSPLPVAIGSPLRKTLPEILERLEKA